MRKLNTTVSVVIVTLVSAVVLSLVNMVTGPIIAANGASAAYASLLAVMPDGENFELLYDANNENGLVDVANTVVEIYKETTGKGFVIKSSTTEGFTHDPIEFTLGISNEGVIVGTELTAYPETRDFGADYPSTYVGEDSTLANVQIVAGVTYSSTAFKKATIDAFNALVANDLMKAAEKSPEQLLTELIPTVFSGACSPVGALQTETQNVNGMNVLVANNGTGAGAIVEDGGKMVLAVINATGTVDVYNTEGENVTEAHSSLVEAMKAVEVKVPASDARTLSKLLDGEFEQLELAGVHSCISSGYKISANGSTYYGFACKPYGFGGDKMDVYYVLDSNGAVYAMTVKEFILEGEYFSAYTLDEDAFKAGFVGVTSETFDGQNLISGATVSSDAIGSAAKAVFEAFELVK